MKSNWSVQNHGRRRNKQTPRLHLIELTNSNNSTKKSGCLELVYN